VVSTGIGGGLVSGGQAADGRTGNAGHIGHMIVDPSGPPCPCGSVGCLEAIASGPSSVRWALAQGWRGGDRTGVGLSAAARDGDPIALAALGRAGEAVGRAAASVTTLLDLDAVVIGGGLASAGEPLTGPLRAAFDSGRTLHYTRRCRLTFAADTAASALLGAAVPHLARGLTGTDWNAGRPEIVLARD
jgi:glucokinase